MEPALNSLSIIKYLAALIGLAVTVYILGNAGNSDRKQVVKKATVTFFLTIAVVALLSLLEWWLLLS